MSKQLLFSVTKKDFDISFFSGTGCGGQNRNKHMNCCRMVHRESGASAVGQSHKEKQSNITDAFNRIRNSIKFKMWHQRKVEEYLEHQTLDEKIDKMMDKENLKVETLKDGKWTEVTSENEITDDASA